MTLVFFVVISTKCMMTTACQPDKVNAIVRCTNDKFLPLNTFTVIKKVCCVQLSMSEWHMVPVQISFLLIVIYIAHRLYKVASTTSRMAILYEWSGKFITLFKQRLTGDILLLE